MEIVGTGMEDPPADLLLRRAFASAQKDWRSLHDRRPIRHWLCDARAATFTASPPNRHDAGTGEHR